MFSFAARHPQLITSRRNPRFQRWLSLWERHGITTHQCCLVAGEKLVNETLIAHADLCHELLESRSVRLAIAAPSHVSRFQLSSSLFQELDRLGTRAPLLVCHLPPIAHVDITCAPEELELLCPLGDPTNLGATIRSGCAFDARYVILLREAAHPFHPKAIRASSGAVFRQRMAWGPSLADLDAPSILQWIVALDLQGRSVSTFAWPEHVRLLVGEEGMGLPPFAFPQRISIIHARTIESLNATVAASIAMFAYRQRHPLCQGGTERYCEDR